MPGASDHLTPSAAEQRLIECAAKGEPADFSTGNNEADDPAKGEAWGEGRTIRAEVLRALATGGRAEWPVADKGV